MTLTDYDSDYDSNNDYDIDDNYDYDNKNHILLIWL